MLWYRKRQGVKPFESGEPDDITVLQNFGRAVPDGLCRFGWPARFSVMDSRLESKKGENVSKWRRKRLKMKSRGYPLS